MSNYYLSLYWCPLFFKHTNLPTSPCHIVEVFFQICGRRGEVVLVSNLPSWCLCLIDLILISGGNTILFSITAVLITFPLIVYKVAFSYQHMLFFVFVIVVF
jgi:hypothetical protein